MGRTIQLLTIADILEINRRMIARFGGIYLPGDRNMANPGSLEHVNQMRIDREVILVSLRVARREIEFEEFVRWVERRTVISA